MTSLDRLRRDLGDIPLERIRLLPIPGTATERDVTAIDAHQDRLCELVDGVLIEKPPGFLESCVASRLIHYLEDYSFPRDLGFTVGEGGMMRLRPGLVRIPDVSFICWDRVPGGRVPDLDIAPFAPDLAVEILGPGNTRREMLRKLREYFAAGARLVWLVDPVARTAEVYTSVDRCVTLDENGVLDGGDVLPGFRLRLGDWLDRVRRRPPPQK